MRAELRRIVRYAPCNAKQNCGERNAEQQCEIDAEIQAMRPVNPEFTHPGPSQIHIRYRVP